MPYNKIIITLDQQITLVKSLLSKKPPFDHKKRFGLYYIPTHDPASLLAKHLEAVVFAEAFNNDEDTMHTEYDIYDNFSSYILAIDHYKNVAIGVIRLMKNSSVGLKTINALAEPPWGYSKKTILMHNDILNDLDNIYDVATLAVLPEYRSNTEHNIGFSMCLALTGFGQIKNVTGYLAILDENVFNKLQITGFPVTQLKGTTSAAYLGSSRSIPTILTAPTWHHQIQTANKSLCLIKTLAMLESNHTYYEDAINPNFEKWLSPKEKHLHKLIKHTPVSILKFFFTWKKLTLNYSHHWL